MPKVALSCRWVGKKIDEVKTDFIGGHDSVSTSLHQPPPKSLSNQWHTSEPVVIHNRHDFQNVAETNSGLGILPSSFIFISNDECLELRQKLSAITPTKYAGTDNDQDVRVFGKPFVDSPTLADHFGVPVSEEIAKLTKPLIARLVAYIQGLGFDVAPLIDSYTGSIYDAGVFRRISVPHDCHDKSVMHTDDITRDGEKKPDFRLPKILQNRRYHQLSFNILLDDGGATPDFLEVWDRRYQPDDEGHVLENGWQFPHYLVAQYQSIRHTPKIGEGYFFSTHQFHDVRGGSPNANRLTFSTFLVYVPDFNLFLLYN